MPPSCSQLLLPVSASVAAARGGSLSAKEAWSSWELTSQLLPVLQRYARVEARQLQAVHQDRTEVAALKHASTPLQPAAAANTAIDDDLCPWAFVPAAAWTQPRQARLQLASVGRHRHCWALARAGPPAAQHSIPAQAPTSPVRAAHSSALSRELIHAALSEAQACQSFKELSELAARLQPHLGDYPALSCALLEACARLFPAVNTGARPLFEVSPVCSSDGGADGGAGGGMPPSGTVQPPKGSPAASAGAVLAAPHRRQKSQRRHQPLLCAAEALVPSQVKVDSDRYAVVKIARLATKFLSKPGRLHPLSADELARTLTAWSTFPAPLLVMAGLKRSVLVEAAALLGPGSDVGSVHEAGQGAGRGRFKEAGPFKLATAQPEVATQALGALMHLDPALVPPQLHVVVGNIVSRKGHQSSGPQLAALLEATLSLEDAYMLSPDTCVTLAYAALRAVQSSGSWQPQPQPQSTLAAELRKHQVSMVMGRSGGGAAAPAPAAAEQAQAVSNLVAATCVLARAREHASVSLLNALADATIDHAALLSPSEIASLVEAYAVLSHPHERLLQALTTHALQHVQQFSLHASHTLMRGLTRAGFHQPQLFAALAQRAAARLGQGRKQRRYKLAVTGFIATHGARKVARAAHRMANKPQPSSDASFEEGSQSGQSAGNMNIDVAHGEDEQRGSAARGPAGRELGAGIVYEARRRVLEAQGVKFAAEPRGKGTPQELLNSCVGMLQCLLHGTSFSGDGPSASGGSMQASAGGSGGVFGGGSGYHAELLGAVSGRMHSAADTLKNAGDIALVRLRDALSAEDAVMHVAAYKQWMRKYLEPQAPHLAAGAAALAAARHADTDTLAAVDRALAFLDLSKVRSWWAVAQAAAACAEMGQPWPFMLHSCMAYVGTACAAAAQVAGAAPAGAAAAAAAADGTDHAGGFGVSSGGGAVGHGGGASLAAGAAARADAGGRVRIHLSASQTCAMLGSLWAALPQQLEETLRSPPPPPPPPAALDQSQGVKGRWGRRRAKRQLEKQRRRRLQEQRRQRQEQRQELKDAATLSEALLRHLLHLQAQPRPGAAVSGGGDSSSTKRGWSGFFSRAFGQSSAPDAAADAVASGGDNAFASAAGEWGGPAGAESSAALASEASWGSGRAVLSPRDLAALYRGYLTLQRLLPAYDAHTNHDDDAHSGAGGHVSSSNSIKSELDDMLRTQQQQPSGPESFAPPSPPAPKEGVAVTGGTSGLRAALAELERSPLLAQAERHWRNAGLGCAPGATHLPPRMMHQLRVALVSLGLPPLELPYRSPNVRAPLEFETLVQVPVQVASAVERGQAQSAADGPSGAGTGADGLEEEEEEEDGAQMVMVPVAVEIVPDEAFSATEPVRLLGDAAFRAWCLSRPLVAPAAASGPAAGGGGAGVGEGPTASEGPRLLPSGSLASSISGAVRVRAGMDSSKGDDAAGALAAQDQQRGEPAVHVISVPFRAWQACGGSVTQQQALLTQHLDQFDTPNGP